MLLQKTRRVLHVSFSYKVFLSTRTLFGCDVAILDEHPVPRMEYLDELKEIEQQIQERCMLKYNNAEKINIVILAWNNLDEKLN